MGAVPRVLSYLLLLLLFSPTAQAQAPRTAGIAGLVVDARDGTPLQGVLVRLHDTQVETTTGPDGRFRIDGVPPGEVGLYVSLVGYGLARRQIDLAPGQMADVTIPLSEG